LAFPQLADAPWSDDEDISPEIKNKMLLLGLPQIPRTQEIIDRAFSKASKVNVPKGAVLIRSQRQARAMIQSAASRATSILDRTVKLFPTFSEIHPFYYDLCDATFGIDQVKKSLGACSWAKRVIGELSGEFIATARDAESPSEASRSQKAFFARTDSILRQIEKDLMTLNDFREFARKLPNIETESHMAIICGAPNVGKSQLLASLSAAKPKIASYPFTTKSISIGHIDIATTRVQLIDTPGLLDRPLAKRNTVEMRAISALNHLEGLFLFIIDPTEYCGYSLEYQESLLANIQKEFPHRSFLKVGNKADINEGERLDLHVSAEDGSGLDELIQKIGEWATDIDSEE